MEIRLAGPEDRVELIGLYHNLLAYLDQYDSVILPTRANASWFVDQTFLPAAARGDPVLIAWENAEPIGAAIWVVENCPYEVRWPHAIEYGVYVTPEWRGKKIGRRLREEAVRILRAKGIHIVLGMVHFANQESLSASDRFGFEPYSRMEILRLSKVTD